MSIVAWPGALSMLQFDSHWRVLPGMACGLPQPVMLGTATVHAAGPVDASALDRCLAPHIAETMGLVDAAVSPAVALLQHALFWAAAAQRQCSVPVFGSGHVAWQTGQNPAASVQVVVPYAAPQASQAALAWVASVVADLGSAQEPAAAALGIRKGLERLAADLQKYKLPGVNPMRFLKAADQLGLPMRRMVQDIYCFGTGRASRWLESSYTDRTSVIGARIARDKAWTAEVLRQAGLPAARHARAANREQAMVLANQLGYPVVVKPADREQGIGVAADLRSAAAVGAAFDAAARHSDNILVEAHFPGQDYRITVFHGRAIKTIVRQAGGVLGDGQHNIAWLVAQASADPQQSRRSRERGQDLLVLDAEALELLAGNALTPDTVPAAGQHVSLRRRANVSAGGTPALVTGTIHPDNLRLAERAATALQLDLAGVDLIMQDIGRSWLETGALICEVNGQPQIGSSTSPGIYRDLLQALLPAQTRLPVALVVGHPGEVDRQLARSGNDRGQQIGHASTLGVWQGVERLCGPQTSAFAAGRIAMANREIDAAVVVMSPAQIVLNGLPVDRCDVVVLAGPDTGPVWSPAELAEMWRMLLPHAGKNIVFPAGRDPWLPGLQAMEAQGVAAVACDDTTADMVRTAAGLLLDGLPAAATGNANRAAADLP